MTTKLRPHAIDITNKRFGKLLVIGPGDFDKFGRRMWWCRCDCGKTTQVHGRRMRAGKTKSCGCLTTATHGMSKHPLWGVWQGMKNRCRNPKVYSFRFYGEKGIDVCDDWNDSSVFINWALDNGWAPGLVIDRINPKEGYKPSNCRFITPSQNSQRLAGKHIGKTYGTWKIVSKKPCSHMAIVECRKCGDTTCLNQSNVVLGKSKQCTCP